MPVVHLRLSNFRNLLSASLEPQAGLNFIVGDNGSGKTSLLESLFFLGRGRSFRTHLSNQLISFGQSELSVFGRVQQGETVFSLGIKRSSSSNLIRVNGETVQRTSHLAFILPVSLMEPGLHSIFDSTPEIRRRFLDWGVFHVEQTYGEVWSRFKRTLSQRNAAIRSGWSAQAISQWDSELIRCAEIISDKRKSYLQDLTSTINKLSHVFSRQPELQISYRPGWKQGVEYARVLQEKISSDMEVGYTQFGPHRADAKFTVEQGLAKDVLSRGQKKIGMAKLVLAQCLQLQQMKKDVTVLIDDLPSELDSDNQVSLLNALVNTGAQVFVTSTSDHLLTKTNNLESKVFHVKQGAVNTV